MRPLPAIALLLLAACSMNNRMHYLQRYASEARRLEQADRRFEANDYWGRATVKADSVLAHRASGRNAGTALGVRGEAQSALGQCADATTSLQQALAAPLDTDDREYAMLALGRCQVLQGAYDLAAESVRPVTSSQNRYRRDQARFITGSAERRLGRDSSAFATLAGIPGRAAMLERTAAAAGAGYPDAVTGLVDSLVALRDSTMPWEGLVRDIGLHDPVAASDLITRLAFRGVITPGQLPAYLLADANRLASVDTARQRARLEQLLQLAPGSDAGVRARTVLALRATAESPDVASLRVAADSLDALAQGPGTAADSALRAIGRITAWVDSAPPGAPQGDLRRFLAAETARDVLQARALAANLFGSIPEGWPSSPYAAKAWLAARQLTGDSASALAYEDSPYLAVLRGGDAAQYAQLEDSLARFARAELSSTGGRADDGPTRAARPRPGGGQVTPGQPAPRQPARGARGQPQRGRKVEDLP